MVDIDKVARIALAKKAAAIPGARVEPCDDDIPVPLNWQIIVEPLRPVTKIGMIQIAEEAREAELWAINVGKVLAMGPLALQGKTASGLDLSVDRDKVKIGIYVQWQRYVGLRIKVRQDSGEDRLFLALAGEELVQVPNDPLRIRYWV